MQTITCFLKSYDSLKLRVDNLLEVEIMSKTWEGPHLQEGSDGVGDGRALERRVTYLEGEKDNFPFTHLSSQLGLLSQKTDEREKNKQKFINMYVSYIHKS